MKVLIVKMSSIGDILQTFFAVDYIKKKHPGAIVHWLCDTRFKDIVESHPHVDSVIDVDTKHLRNTSFKKILKDIARLKSLKYDLLFDLQGNIKSSIISLFIQAPIKAGYEFRSAPEWPHALTMTHRYPVQKDEPIVHQYLSILQQYFKDREEYVFPKIRLNLSQSDIDFLSQTRIEIPINCLMICFGSNWKNKRMKKRHLIALLKSIAKEYQVHFIFIYKSEEEKLLAKQLGLIFSSQAQVVGNLSIPLWQYLMSKCRGVISMDSAALHLAAHLRLKTFAFFGPSNAQIYNPLGKEHMAYQGPCPYQVQFVKRCPFLRTCETGDCMHSIDLDLAFVQIKRWLN
ncbi:MAG: glycosyltransferase family 9 protein [Simkaniaceae bacterium]|nr:glycosyltransferase family 9 protein [Simkaniaceae bacterium]MCF7852039.1 glycosyltransferase family 9 protein [Simkaniaceae bacterium]